MSENEISQGEGIENIEIEPLSDEALEAVAGGGAGLSDGDSADGSGCTCSCQYCS
jgi:hypothetical protein